MYSKFIKIQSIFHLNIFISARCAALREIDAVREREKEQEREGERERARATKALVGKNGKTKQKTRRIEGKIRSKAQIFARINGDDDDDEDDESRGLRMSRKISSIEASRGVGEWKAAGSSEGHVAYENRKQKQQQQQNEREGKRKRRR